MKRCAWFVLSCLLCVPAVFAGEETWEQAEDLFVSGQYGRALELLEKILAKDPSNAAALRRRGNCYEQAGEYEEALRDYSQAIQVDPVFFDAYYDKALLLYNTLKKKEQAMDTLSAAVTAGYKKKGDKSALARVHILRSYIFRAQKDFASAEKDLTHALYLVSDAITFMLRGELRMQMGQIADAKTDLKKALNLIREGDAESADLRRNIQDLLNECEHQGREPESASEDMNSDEKMD